jgi:hypothetical protein
MGNLLVQPALDDQFHDLSFARCKPPAAIDSVRQPDERVNVIGVARAFKSDASNSLKFSSVHVAVTFSTVLLEVTNSFNQSLTLKSNHRAKRVHHACSSFKIDYERQFNKNQCGFL